MFWVEQEQLILKDSGKPLVKQTPPVDDRDSGPLTHDCLPSGQQWPSGLCQTLTAEPADLLATTSLPRLSSAIPTANLGLPPSTCHGKVWSGLFLAWAGSRGGRALPPPLPHPHVAKCSAGRILSGNSLASTRTPSRDHQLFSLLSCTLECATWRGLLGGKWRLTQGA